MKVLHIVPGLDERTNGIAVAARLIADGQRAEGHQVEMVSAKDFASSSSAVATSLCQFAEVWVHSMWTPTIWKSCWKVLKSRATIGTPRLVRMTHANLDPLRYRYHGWKKRMAAPIERWLFSRTDRLVATGAWEAEWCRQWGLANEIETVDLRRFFDFNRSGTKQTERTVTRQRPLHVLYLGRRHPLKGVGLLERAVESLNPGDIELKTESSLFGAEKEAAWDWCDVFCLPTLSENFGLVVAEALEHGKRVITTDGAPAWEQEEGRLTYLRGYRDGTDETRVKLLKDALEALL